MRAVLRTGILLLAAIGAVSCQRDPLDQKVSARTAMLFDIWRSNVASDSSPEHRQQVETALQEIRMHIAGERELKRHQGEPVSAESIDETLRQAVDGRPVRDVLQHGYELRVQRLASELAGLEDAMKQNAQLVTKPGDYASRHHLEELHERQTVRLEKYREELAAAKRVLEPLSQASGKTFVQEAVDDPDEMPQRVVK